MQTRANNRAHTFMDWTVIPPSLLAFLWSDDEFRELFLSCPTPTLRASFEDCPSEAEFVVVENTEDTTHLILPHRPIDTYGWSRSKIEQVLLEETRDDNTLQFWPPVDIMVEAFCNPAFKRELIIDPKKVFESYGYQLKSHHYVVLENTEDVFHLALPINKWQEHDLDIDELHQLIIEEQKPLMVH